MDLNAKQSAKGRQNRKREHKLRNDVNCQGVLG